MKTLPGRNYGTSTSAVIRLGNSQHPDVVPYSESTLRSRDNGVLTQKKKILEDFRDACRHCLVLSEHAQLFSSFRADMLNDFGGKFSQQLLDSHQQQKYRSKAAYEATEVMLSSIVREKLLAEQNYSPMLG